MALKEAEGQRGRAAREERREGDDDERRRMAVVGDAAVAIDEEEACMVARIVVCFCSFAASQRKRIPLFAQKEKLQGEGKGE